MATVKDCIGRYGFRFLFWVNMGWEKIWVWLGLCKSEIYGLRL